MAPAPPDSGRLTAGSAPLRPLAAGERTFRSRYLVEWYGPDLTDEVLRRTARTIDRSAGEMAAEGTVVDLLLAMFVPTDEVAFCLFAADSPTSVVRVCRRARLPVHRITEALTHQPSAGKAETR